ncbi:Phospholipase D [Fasciolopsis buskii]|uniref:phospholipase D n=1 Tax=Fasciolopsis buskii TaxID=27845 RepID=A0A8E0RQK4_9TREM|nr:Phospholipase D [Fasciolopsis buski]
MSQPQKSPPTKRKFSLHPKASGEGHQLSWHMPKPFQRNPPILTDRRKREIDHERPAPDMDQLRHRGFTGVFQRAGVALHALFTRRSSNAPKPSSHSGPALVTEDNLMFLESRWDEVNEGGAYDNLGFEDDDGEPVDPSLLDDLDNLYKIGQRCTFIGQDYVNWNVCEPDGKEHAAKDLLDRQEVPRMPWHDVACVLSGQIASDFSRHFIQRWNAIRTSRIRLATKGTSEREKRRRKPLLIPSEPCAPWTTDKLDHVLRDPRQASLCQVQALRSVSIWSLAVPAGNVKRGYRTEFRRWLYGHSPKPVTPSPNERERGLETSILSAYVNSILDAKSFILIENQFFISYIMSSDFNAQVHTDTPEDPSRNKPAYSAAADTDPHERLPKTHQIAQVKNRIVDAIFLRILRAHKEGKPFRVFIILPLVPGFPGEFGNPTSRSQHIIWHYTRLSLFSGEQALFPRLARQVPDPNDYVSVCGLRTFEEWPNGNLKTELIYVHSKVMVIDDRLMIVGSANLNDRSTRGKRDSELAVLIENNPYQSDQPFCPFVRRFRRSLMAEHLGVLPTLKRVNRDEWSDDLLNDPVRSEFFHGVWQATAKRNAEIFEEVFNVIPCNRLKTFNDCKEHRQKIPMSVHSPRKALELLQQVRGYLVRFPEEFLASEDLTPPPGTMEKLAPALIWL